MNLFQTVAVNKHIKIPVEICISAYILKVKYRHIISVDQSTYQFS